jgi:hypothetical protein
MGAHATAHYAQIKRFWAWHATRSAVAASVWAWLRTGEKLLEQVEGGGELREEHDAVAVGLELGEQPIEQLELARAVDELLRVRLVVAGLDTREEVRVVAALTQLRTEATPRAHVTASVRRDRTREPFRNGRGSVQARRGALCDDAPA